MFYVYVIKSLKDGNIYIGHTGNLRKRIALHNAGKINSTEKRRPFSLLYYEACNLLKDAVQREHALKTGFGRAYLKRRLSNI
ncbi:MAG: excinuclease ABC subunit C [Candidatus Moranbacteria bacterium CG_4_9_14_3_um_filter_42_9]|nr:MAG: excinuclease ABC subunit C [Candidatus Moranbacteria bacterium CG_4_9_14_3_um_filter_42_9]